LIRRIRDRDGKLLGDERLGGFHGHANAFAGEPAEKRLGELDKHGVNLRGERMG
jgi:hypothetical protein